jgi:hypothetical protein
MFACQHQPGDGRADGEQQHEYGQKNVVGAEWLGWDGVHAGQLELSAVLMWRACGHDYKCILLLRKLKHAAHTHTQ